MSDVNRLAAPLPQSVLDRYRAEHPEEGLPKAAAHVAGLSRGDLDALPSGAIVGRPRRTQDRYTKNEDGTWTGSGDGVTVGSHRVPTDGYEVLHDGKTAAVQPPTEADEDDFEKVAKIFE